MCPRGQQRDEFGFCFDDKDCNVTSSSIEDAFSEIDEADADTLAALINEYGKEFGIDNLSKLHHFLGQSNHELGGFSDLHNEESMNYSVENVLSVFGNKFSITGELPISMSPLTKVSMESLKKMVFIILLNLNIKILLYPN